MESPTVELRSALASLFECGKYSDLTIVCGSKRYPVHRALLATRSTFFEGACRGGFQESATGVIDLTEDDAEAVEHMVHYFYHLDYLNKPLSHQHSQRSSRPQSPSPVTSRFTRRSPPKKLNLAFMDDPLLAQMSAASPLTPPAEETLFQPLDASVKFPDTPMAEQFADDYTESAAMEPEVDVESAHLVTHAKVYAIAEKYGIAGLKSLARSKFSYQISMHLNSPEFADACQEAYESTFHTDRGLRDVIIQTFRANPDLSMREDVEMAVRETPGLAFELFRMASGLPVSS
ncbi:BTB/POZ domain-containing protein [Stagonosporopsis vannaccii]|nr:BTB/POZ domain-containing protein [Stagonosporopsis vannaccii]